MRKGLLMSRLIAGFLTVALVLSCSWSPVYAEAAGNIDWQVTYDGELIISGYGEMENYSESSCAPWYDSREYIYRITVQDGVTAIGDMAFDGMSAAMDIRLPEGLTSIGECAFLDCSSLESISLPDSISYIGPSAFSYCLALKNVNLPRNVTYVGKGAFWRCESLTSITFPEGMTSIEYGSFQYCTGLKSVTLPRTMAYIGEDSFEGCDELADVYYAGTPEEWAEIDIREDNECLLNANIHFGEVSHSWDAGTIMYYPTCTEKGLMVYRCTDYSCTAEYTEELAPLGHDFSQDWITDVPSTCFEEGIRSHHCRRCGEKKDVSPIDKKDHVWNQGEVVKEPACVEPGTMVFTCTTIGCGENFEQEIDALGHDFSPEWTIDAESTCSEAGRKSRHCSRCDEITDVTELPLVPHDKETIITRATTDEDGSIVKHCAVCEEIFSETMISYPKTISLSEASYVYNGQEQKPEVAVVDAEGEVIEPSNYTVAYSGECRNVGKYTVKITFKGRYSGSVSKTFTIVPKGTTVKSLTAGSKSITVKWAKQAIQTTGYQIQYATGNKFASPKTVTVTKNTAVSKTISNLLGKKKYYVRIRTYKTVSGTKYYSAWSAAKYVTTKR